MTGFIYAIRCMDRVKIGHSVRPTERIEQIRPYCPFPIEFLGVKEGRQREEKHLHKVFAKHRTHGEWFFIDGKEVQEFLATLHEFSPPVVFIGDPLTSDASDKMEAIGWIDWRGACGLTFEEFCALKDGLAVPKAKLAAIMQEQLGIPADAWPLQEKAAA